MADSIEQVQRALTAYIVERELGSGGMATVYLAHDRKHDRKVAIKVLRAELSAVLGAERFLQEIRVTANLQHTHILGLIDSGLIGFDAGELKGRPYYVMPYVEGESLRQRLDKERQLQLSDAVRIAEEVASALDYAHRQGVIHRDIKPENIMLHDGVAIVADFGISLAVTHASGERMTQTGFSVGTPCYMSPEQAMGQRAITARSDIYSLGAVTYEMLAGEPPFTGPTVQAILSRVMTEEPRPLATQRRTVPPHVDATVTRALQKVPADRFSSAREFAEALNTPSASAIIPAAANRNATRGRTKWMLYGATALAALLLAVGIRGWMRSEPSKPVVRYNLALDPAEAMVPGASSWGWLAISPDGSHLAYIGGPDGPRAQLLIRPRNQLHATVVPGTEGASGPFFSPDGDRVGFVKGKIVQIVSLNGGPAVIVTDTLVGWAGASWARDGFIYADGDGSVSLVRVEAKPGAMPTDFTTLDTTLSEVDHLWPDVLPNGKGVLFTDEFRGKNAPRGGTSFAIAVAEIPSGKHRVLVDDAMFGRYAASGHLLYVTNRTLMIVPFDQRSMTVTGEPTALIEGVVLGPAFSANLAVSDEGTLIYATGVEEGNQELVWVTRDGKTQPVDPDLRASDLQSPALSPDGKRLAVTRGSDNKAFDIWIKPLDRGPSIRLTLEGSGNFYPTWTRDGRSVTFTSNSRAGSYDLWTKRDDGSAPAVLQVHEKWGLWDPLWSPDGKWLIFAAIDDDGRISDIRGIRPGIDTASVPLVATQYLESSPALSPDGRWLAYRSNESGQNEIYVVPFPNTGAAKWAVSTRGGTDPQWSHKGSELFYRDASGNLVAVEVTTTPTFSLLGSTSLFPAEGYDNWYVVAPDDRRFLMIRPVPATGPDKVIVVENWFEELAAKSRK